MLNPFAVLIINICASIRIVCWHQLKYSSTPLESSLPFSLFKHLGWVILRFYQIISRKVVLRINKTQISLILIEFLLYLQYLLYSKTANYFYEPKTIFHCCNLLITLSILIYRNTETIYILNDLLGNQMSHYTTLFFRLFVEMKYLV